MRGCEYARMRRWVEGYKYYTLKCLAKYVSCINPLNRIHAYTHIRIDKSLPSAVSYIYLIIIFFS